MSPSRCFAPASIPFAHTVVSWSLPSVPTCSAPAFSSLAPVAPGFSFVPSAPPPPPSLPPSSSSSLPFSSAPPPCASSTASASISAPPSSSDAFATDWSGAAGSSVPDGAFYYSEFDDSSVKGEKEETALSKAAFSKAFYEGFFPGAKPDSSSSSTEDSVLWEDICGPSSGRHPRIFLTLFDKMKSLSKEVSEKFCKAADERKKTSSALPRWGVAYRLGNFPEYHKALRVNESFERLLGSLSLCLGMSFCRWMAFPSWKLVSMGLWRLNPSPFGPLWRCLSSSRTPTVFRRTLAFISSYCLLPRLSLPRLGPLILCSSLSNRPGISPMFLTSLVLRRSRSNMPCSQLHRLRSCLAKTSS